jgi:hypothetical protein
MPLLEILKSRAAEDPFNVVATAIFLLAIIHTFMTARIGAFAHRAPASSVRREVLHFFAEVEVVFGLWAVPLLAAFAWFRGWDLAKYYTNNTVNYTEALFVVVIMALASTRPIVGFAEAGLRRVATLFGATPAAWWATILVIGPILGSFITEPAAMTICALLLGRQFFDLQPSERLKYATLGLLFVNVSIGGTLTHFAAPPVLMVARTWEWTTPFMLVHFGWHSMLAIAVSTTVYFLFFRRDLQALALRPPVPEVDRPDDDAETLLPVPAWLVAVHIAFIIWTVANAHYPVLFVAGFMFFLGFAKATANYQVQMELRTPLLVGFFLAGLVIHGGLQAWWIAPVLESLSSGRLFIGATVLTAFNDNALITYLATLVPDLSETLKIAVVGGAVTGGGLTVIANAPNPAGQALLARFFDGVVSPLGLFLGALVPTIIAAIALYFL